MTNDTHLLTQNHVLAAKLRQQLWIVQDNAAGVR